jgi:uncharacterized circularly permuted ATP-grasp superfamily protein
MRSSPRQATPGSSIDSCTAAWSRPAPTASWPAGRSWERDRVERDVPQRIRTLEAFLDDAYGSGQVFRDGVVPRQLVVSSKHFHRAAFGVRPPNGVRVHVAGVDLVRDENGEFRVLEDNLRTPSGVSYVVENRQALARVLPDLLAGHVVRPVNEYPVRLLAAPRAAAPPGVEDPCVVVLTPGVYNAAYSEHTLLARQTGVRLVEGRDLEVVANEVRMRTTRGHQRVDVIYRRIDDQFLDPVHFRTDSVVGCPGLLNASRAGHVTLANAIGNGGPTTSSSTATFRISCAITCTRTGAAKRRDLASRHRRESLVRALQPW